MQKLTDEQKKERVLEKIRNRASYKTFKEWLDFLNKKPSTEQILNKVHSEIDNRKGFGSEQNSASALESMRLVVEDYGRYRG